MNNIAREVILDLFPIYLAGEASSATAELVEEYLKTDPELAKMVEEAAETGSMGDVPNPITKENIMEAYKKTNKWVTIRTIGLAAIIAVVLLNTLLIFTVVILFLR